MSKGPKTKSKKSKTPGKGVKGKTAAKRKVTPTQLRSVKSKAAEAKAKKAATAPAPKDAAPKAAAPKAAAPKAAAPKAAEPVSATVEPTAKPTAPGAAAVQEAKGTGGWIGRFALIALLAVAGGAGFATWPMWSPAVAPYIPGLQDDRVAEVKPAPTRKPDTDDARLRKELSRLIARMESIEQAVKSVKRMIRATAPPSEKLGPDLSMEHLTKRLDQLQKNDGAIKALLQRMDQLEKESVAERNLAADDGPLSTTAAEIESRLQSTGSGESQPSGPRAIMLAVALLREALANGQPFEKVFQSLKAAAGDDPAIKAASILLKKSASTGIPTSAGLRERFGHIAGKIVTASKALEEHGWMERAANRIRSLVDWRWVDQKEEDDSVDAGVARAEKHLKAGDLTAAVEAVKGLMGNPKVAPVAEPWLADAKRRLAAERAIQALHVHALALLTSVKE